MDTPKQIEELKAELTKLRDEVTDQRVQIDQLNAEMAAVKNRVFPNRSLNQRPVPVRKEPVSLENLIGLKLIHFVGIVVLIIGLSIAVKYAIDENLISPALRIGLTYLAGAVLFFLSIKLKSKYQLFSIILFSGAMASIYFTTFAAYTYYDMLPRIPAFGIMLLLTLFTVYHALKYDRQEIAILGLAGAYGIPFFVRGNTDNLTALFSYIFIINCGILFLSFKKYWQSLLYIAFFTTWIIFFSSYVLSSESIHTSSSKVFSFAFFLLFLASTVGAKLYKQEKILITEQGFLLIDTAFLYAALILIYGTDPATEYITLGFSIVYAAAAVLLRLLLRQEKNLQNVLFSISMLALIAFIPMHFTGLTTTIIWGVLAIAFFITGTWLRLDIFRAGAIFLFTISILKLLSSDSEYFTSVQKVIAYIFTGTVLLIVSFLYQKFKGRIFNQEE